MHLLLGLSNYTLTVILLRKEHSKHQKGPECSGVTNSEDSHGEDETQTEKDQENYWQPWAVSIVVDFVAMVLRYTQNMSPLEKEEAKRRDYLLLFYFLRGPMYSLFTR